MDLKVSTTLTQERLRQIAWEIGHRYPIPHEGDYIALSMIHPRLGYVHWHADPVSAGAVSERSGDAVLVVRVYDVTNIIFSGFNAHMLFDLYVNGLSGNYYFRVDRTARNYLAEIGFRSRDGSFHPIARSNTAYFDRDRPSGNYQVTGLFVGGAFNRAIPVENVFDAPAYERINHELTGMERKEALRIAVVFVGFNGEAGFSGPLGSYINNFFRRLRKFAGHAELFSPLKEESDDIPEASLMNRIQTLSRSVYKALQSACQKIPFHIMHCHDWYSSAVGLKASKELNLPMVLSLHSTEYERTNENNMGNLSLSICEWERSGVQAAALVIVPHESTRQKVIDFYDAAPEKVVIIPDLFIEKPPHSPPDVSEVKRWFGLNHDAPMVFFAGEISHAAGADLLADALPTVCRNHHTAQFVFAGDGPLKGELEARSWHNGISHRCRFLGDVSRETFEILLKASDFVVIPARTWQDECLARTAIGFGKPVLTTHQAGIKCVVHGQNGLITFDNPGSIVWGIQEMLFNPLNGSMLRIVARRNANEALSLDNIALQHYLFYEMALKGIGE